MLRSKTLTLALALAAVAAAPARAQGPAHDRPGCEAGRDAGGRGTLRARLDLNGDERVGPVERTFARRHLEVARDRAHERTEHRERNGHRERAGSVEHARPGEGAERGEPAGPRERASGAGERLRERLDRNEDGRVGPVERALARRRLEGAREQLETRRDEGKRSRARGPRAEGRGGRDHERTRAGRGPGCDPHRGGRAQRDEDSGPRPTESRTL